MLQLCLPLGLLLLLLPLVVVVVVVVAVVVVVVAERSVVGEAVEGMELTGVLPPPSYNTGQ